MSGDADLNSLRRRLRFAGIWRHAIDAAQRRLGIRWPRLAGVVHKFGTVLFDGMEIVRTRGRLSHPTRPIEAAMTAQVRLPQEPHNRNYWYDPHSHSLIGLVLGLDLHRHRGKYYLLENNVRPALNPERRQLYESELDPFIIALLKAAATRKFERLVLLRHEWSDGYFDEFERASRASRIEVIGGVGRPSEKGCSWVLPDPPAAKTLYADWGQRVYTPVSHLIHNKLWSVRWLQEMLEAEGEPKTGLTWVPTYDHLVLPTESTDAHWPNLVVKLANAGKGEYVLMGRFHTEDEARRELRLPFDDPHAIPGIFKLSWGRRLMHRLLPRAEVVYQPFIPSEPIDDRAWTIRLNVFISPFFDTFLSAFAKICTHRLPGRLAPGLVTDDRPFVCNFARGAFYAKLESDVEEEVRVVAAEFGRLARLAITRKFETGPPGAF